MDDSHWDRSFDRDTDREPTHGTRPRAKLNPTGSVRAATMPKCRTEDHESAKTDEVLWSAFYQNGIMPSYNDEGPPAVLELATCPKCKSTCAREVPASTEAALALLRREGLL